MLANRAIPATSLAGTPPEGPRHPILTSILPALDTAFGLEPPDLFPDAIVALIQRLIVLDEVDPADLGYGTVDFLEAA